MSIDVETYTETTKITPKQVRKLIRHMKDLQRKSAYSHTVEEYPTLKLTYDVMCEAYNRFFKESK